MPYQPTKKPTNVDHVDHDEQTGTSIGMYLEPEAVEDMVSGRVDDTATDGKPKEVKGNAADDEFRYGKDARSDIYANSARVRDHQNAEMLENDEDAAEFTRRMDIEAAGGDPNKTDSDAPTEEELAGAQAIADEQPGTDKKPPTDAKVAKDTEEWVELTVYGEKQYARYSEVEEAGGVEQLQKRRAADRLMIQNATIRRDLDTERKSLATNKAEFLKQVRDFAGQRVAFDEQQATTTGSTPTGDQPGGVGDGPYDLSIVDNLFDSDRDSAKANLSKLLTQVAANAYKLGAKADPASLEDRTDTLTDEITKSLGFDFKESDVSEVSVGNNAISDLDRDAVNLMFQNNYPDMWGSDDAFTRVASNLARRRELPENQGRPIVDLGREAAEEIKATFWDPSHAVRGQPAPQETTTDASTTVLPHDEVARRIASKRKTPAPTSSAKINRTEEKPEIPRKQRDSTYIRTLQQQRGQRV